MDNKPPRRPFEETHPHLKEFSLFLPKLNDESDRGMALIATSFIDDVLRRVLLAFMVEGKTSTSLVEGERAPLGTFAARTEAAYALGLITDNEKQEAARLRRVRNRFAHDVNASFADTKIFKICNELTMSARPPNFEPSARGLFSTAAIGLIPNITNRPHYVALQRRGAAQWKI